MPPSKPTKAKPKLQPASPAKPAAPPKAAGAYAAVLAEMAKLDPSELSPVNVDIPHAVSIALGALPNLLALRDAIATELPKHPIALLDHLERYALGAWYAYLLAQPAAGAGNPVKPLDDEATALRENLLSDAEALARRGLLDADAIAAIRAGQGQEDKANDLVALSATFLTNWEGIKDKTAATLEEVLRAGDLGPLLLAALGLRERGAPARPSDAKDNAARAFTLFYRAYDQSRRGVAYLRWAEGDADSIAPSLYKGRGGRGAPASPPVGGPQPDAPAPVVAEKAAGK